MYFNVLQRGTVLKFGTEVIGQKLEKTAFSLAVHSFGCHHAKNGPIHKKMVVDCPLVIISKVEPVSKPDKAWKDE